MDESLGSGASVSGWNPAMLLKCCVALGKFVDLSMPPFPHLQMSAFCGFWEDPVRYPYKALERYLAYSKHPKGAIFYYYTLLSMVARTQSFGTWGCSLALTKDRA